MLKTRPWCVFNCKCLKLQLRTVNKSNYLVRFKLNVILMLFKLNVILIKFNIKEWKILKRASKTFTLVKWCMSKIISEIFDKNKISSI